MNNDADKNKLISLAEAADIYGFNADYLRQLSIKGRLRSHKIGKFWVTTANDVEEFIRSRQERGAFRADIELSN